LIPVSGTTVSYYLRFGMDPGTGTYLYPFVLASSGAVGIGTSSPTTNLHVVGTGGVNIQANSGSWGAKIYEDGGSNLHFNVASTDKMYISNAGNVGIGTNSPSTKLHVLASGTVATFGDGSATCSITPSTAGNVTCSSDARLKRDIASVADSISLDKILRLNTVTYKWKNGDEKIHTGYIAQEVEKIVPEMVIDGNDGFKQVSYVGFVPLVTGAIKEIYKKIENLSLNKQVTSNEIISLKKQNEDLNDKVKKLESENQDLKQIKNYICTKDPKASMCFKK